MTDRPTRCTRAMAAAITNVADARVHAYGRTLPSGTMTPETVAARPLSLSALPGALVLARPSTA